MWRHCTVCSTDLGQNAEVEHFQVGTRLAFDSTRGRLWVICPGCERWNLTPLDIRWEALEDLERLWEKTKIRVSSDQMALGRTPGGMWLIRVGKDGGGGEFAFWRWGRRGSWHRRFTGKNAPWWLAAGVAGAGLISISPPVLPVVAGVVGLKAWFYLHMLKARNAMVSLDRDGQPHRFTRADLGSAGLTPADDELGWSVQLQRWVNEEGAPVDPMAWRGPAKQEFVEYRGHEAEEIARKALPLLNNRRFRDREVSEAVKLIEENPDPESFLTHVAGLKPRWVPLKKYPEPLRLGLEMALFQEREREAMEGELGRLEEAWREAEKIAEISDSLLPPKGWEGFRAKHRGGS